MSCTCSFWRRIFFAYSYYSVAFSCSCPPESWGFKPRDVAIREGFEFSSDVYTAVVSAADCKCFPQSNTTARLDCLSYVISENNVVVESIGKRYECLYGFAWIPYPFLVQHMCNEVKTLLVSSATVDSNPVIPRITNVTGQNNCGISGFSGEGCQLSYQPCFYNVTVGTVYKGNLVTGDVVVTSGPDVLTTCGQYGRVLTLGVEYVVGIGGTCDPMSAWSTLESYSESEVALLGSLQECAENPSNCTMATDAMGTDTVGTDTLGTDTMGTDAMDTYTIETDAVETNSTGTHEPVVTNDTSGTATMGTGTDLNGAMASNLTNTLLFVLIVLFSYVLH